MGSGDRGARPQVGNNAEGSPAGRGREDAGAGARCPRTNKGGRGHFPSHATCGGRRVNCAHDSRASRPPLPPSLGNAGSGGGAGGAAEGGNLFRAPGGGGRGARVRAPAVRRRGDRPRSPSARAPPPFCCPLPCGARGVFLAPPELPPPPPSPPLLLSQAWVSQALLPPLPLRSV